MARINKITILLIWPFVLFFVTSFELKKQHSIIGTWKGVAEHLIEGRDTLDLTPNQQGYKNDMILTFKDDGMVDVSYFGNDAFLSYKYVVNKNKFTIGEKEYPILMLTDSELVFEQNHSLTRVFVLRFRKEE